MVLSFTEANDARIVPNSLSLYPVFFQRNCVRCGGTYNIMAKGVPTILIYYCVAELCKKVYNKINLRGTGISLFCTYLYNVIFLLFIFYIFILPK